MIHPHEENAMRARTGQPQSNSSERQLRERVRELEGLLSRLRKQAVECDKSLGWIRTELRAASRNPMVQRWLAMLEISDERCSEEAGLMMEVSAALNPKEPQP